MAKVVTIELQAKTKEAQRELDLINQEIQEQKELTIDLQKEQLRLEEQLKRTPKSAIGAQRRLKSEIKDLGLAIKDNNLGLRQLNLERSKVTKTTSNLAKGTKSLTDRVSQNYGVTGLLNTLTGGLASRYRDAYTAVTGLSTGLKGLRAALLATGIGAIVVAVGLLAANWEKVTDFLSGTTKAQKLYNEAVDEGNKAAYEATQTLKTLRDVALDETASTEAREQALKKLSETVKDLNDVSLDQEDALQLIVDKTEPYIQAVMARAKAEAFAKILAEEEVALLKERAVLGEKMNNITEKEDAIRKKGFRSLIDGSALLGAFTYQMDVIQGLGSAKTVADLTKSVDLLSGEYDKLIQETLELEAVVEQTDEAAEERFEKEKERAREEKRLEEQRIKDAERAAEKAAQIAEQNRRDEAQAKVDLKNTIAEIEQQNLERVLSNEQKEKNAVLDKFFTITEAARQAGIDATIIEEEKQAQLAAIDKKYRDQEKKLADDVQKAKFQSAASTFGAIKQLAGEGSKVGKAAAIAQATISSIEGTQNAFTTAAKSPITTVFPAYPFIQAGVAAAAGLANIRAIKSTKVGVGATPSAPSGGGAGASTPTEAAASIPPAFNIVGASGTNQLAEAIGGQAQQPVKAFVVSNDVSTAQELDRNIVEGASIG
jgi:hypothetical protein